jgi:hypothetical protein
VGVGGKIGEEVGGAVAEEDLDPANLLGDETRPSAANWIAVGFTRPVKASVVSWNPEGSALAPDPPMARSTEQATLEPARPAF